MIAQQVDGLVKWGKRAKGEHLMAMIETDDVIQSMKKLIAERAR